MTEQNLAGETIVDDRPITIQQALNAVMIDVGAVRKDERNTHANYNFRGIDAVVNASSPAFRKHGVVVMPRLVSVTYDKVTTTGNKPQVACRVVVDYTFTGPMGDDLTCTVAGEAWDGGDKATPQAMSVAFRVALLQALCLPTDDIEVDSVTHQMIQTPMATVDQMGALRDGFKANSMSGDDNRAARLDFFRDVLGRDTNGGDLTLDEAALCIVRLQGSGPTPEQQANLEQTLGAQPLADGQQTGEAAPDGPRTAAVKVGEERRANAAQEPGEAYSGAEANQ